MKDLIIIAILLLIVGGVSFFIYKAKKRGDACIGCPHAKECGRARSGCCGGCKAGHGGAHVKRDASGQNGTADIADKVDAPDQSGAQNQCKISDQGGNADEIGSQDQEGQKT